MGCRGNVRADEDLLRFLNNLEKEEYKLEIIKSENELNKNNFYKTFYKDFLAKKVDFISQNYKTDNLNDPKLQKYLNKYPKFKFERGQVLGNEDDFMIVNKKYPHYNFKVYQINFDNNEENGKEDVFYSGGYWNEEEKYGYSSYVILNKNSKNIINPYINSKSYMGGELVEPEYEGENKERTKNYTGIIEYKNKYYIYEISNDVPIITIDFYYWDKKYKNISYLLTYMLEIKGDEDE
jgi:hypothetical protein